MAKGKPADYSAEFTTAFTKVWFEAARAEVRQFQQHEFYSALRKGCWSFEIEPTEAAVTMGDEIMADLTLELLNASSVEREVYGPIVPLALRAMLSEEAEVLKKRAAEMVAAARLNATRKRTYAKHKSGHASRVKRAA
jgi:hypothetical protein